MAHIGQDTRHTGNAVFPVTIEHEGCVIKRGAATSVEKRRQPFIGKKSYPITASCSSAGFSNRLLSMPVHVDSLYLEIPPCQLRHPGHQVAQYGESHEDPEQLM